MSSGPLAELVNAQQTPPAGGLPTGGLVGGDVNGNVLQNAPSNTGAGQFLNGPLGPNDFLNGVVYNSFPSIGNPPGGLPGTRPGGTPYNPDARPWMGGGNRGLLNTRMR